MNALCYKQPAPCVLHMTYNALDLGLAKDFRQGLGWVMEHGWLQSDAIGQHSGFVKRPSNNIV